MPLVHIHLMEGRSPKEIKAIADGVQKALGVAWKFKVGRFQIVQEHKKSHFYIDQRFGGYKRTTKAVMIVIVAIKLSKAAKLKTYSELPKVLKKLVRKDDLYVTLIEVGKKINFSVGGGVPV